MEEQLPNDAQQGVLQPNATGTTVEQPPISNVAPPQGAETALVAGVEQNVVQGEANVPNTQVQAPIQQPDTNTAVQNTLNQTLLQGTNEGTDTSIAPTTQQDKNGPVGQLTTIANDLELVIVRANLEGSSKKTTTIVTLEDFTRVELSHGEGVIVPREYGETLTRLDGGVLFIDDTINVKLDIVPA